MAYLIRSAVLVMTFAASLAGWSAASAAVEISFYSRELGGSSFPHAFVTMKGTVDSDGTVVDQSYGFTARSITHALLLGSVTGMIQHEKPSFVARSDKQFSVLLSEDQYQAVKATIERWETKAQPSYNLDRANCVHFAGEMAQAAGLRVEFRPELMKKPRSFLLAVKADNAQLLAGQPPAANDDSPVALRKSQRADG